MALFRLLISLGGVTVTVEENISDSFSNCYMTPGTWTINGDQALGALQGKTRKVIVWRRSFCKGNPGSNAD